jgi:hypothetical protein
MDRTPTKDRTAGGHGSRRHGLVPLGTLLAIGLAGAVGLIGPRPAAGEPTVVEPVRPDVRVDDGHSDESQAFFDSRDVPDLKIDVGDAGLASLRKDPRKPVRATVIERVGKGDAVRATVYRDVAVHLKGGSGSFRPVDDRPAITLDFHEFHPGQQFHGLDKVHLNNSVQDPTYMEEILSG